MYLKDDDVSFFTGSRSHGGGVPDRQVLLDAHGQEARRRPPRQARQEHDRAAHRAQMSRFNGLYIAPR